MVFRYILLSKNPVIHGSPTFDGRVLITYPRITESFLLGGYISKINPVNYPEKFKYIAEKVLDKKKLRPNFNFVLANLENHCNNIISQIPGDFIIGDFSINKSDSINIGGIIQKTLDWFVYSYSNQYNLLPDSRISKSSINDISVVYHQRSFHPNIGVHHTQTSKIIPTRPIETLLNILKNRIWDPDPTISILTALSIIDPIESNPNEAMEIILKLIQSGDIAQTTNGRIMA